MSTIVTFVCPYVGECEVTTVAGEDPPSLLPVTLQHVIYGLLLRCAPAAVCHGDVTKARVHDPANGSGHRLPDVGVGAKLCRVFRLRHEIVEPRHELAAAGSLYLWPQSAPLCTRFPICSHGRFATGQSVTLEVQQQQKLVLRDGVLHEIVIAAVHPRVAGHHVVATVQRHVIVVGGDRREVAVALETGGGELRRVRVRVQLQCGVARERVLAPPAREAVCVAAGAPLAQLAPRLGHQGELGAGERREAQLVEANGNVCVAVAVTGGKLRHPRAVLLELVPLLGNVTLECDATRWARH